MEVLTVAPKTSSFVPLAEHETTTPASFYSGPPILHYHSDRCKLVVLESELSTTSVLANLVEKSTSTANGALSKHEIVNGKDENTDTITESRKQIEDVDVWVTSDKLLMYSTPAQTGLSIPYPSISLHAIQSLPQPSSIDTTSQGLYMQIVNSSASGNNNGEEDEELDTFSITIIPTASSVPVPDDTSDADAAVETEIIPEITPVQAMFTALSNCSNLHPEPVDEDDENGATMAFEGSEFYRAGLLQPGINDGSGGLPPPMPGSGGWITAENMHEYFNELGEYIGPSGDGEDDEMEDSVPLGPGAGHTRPAQNDGNGDDETKWRRTE